MSRISEAVWKLSPTAVADVEVDDLGVCAERQEVTLHFATPQAGR